MRGAAAIGPDAWRALIAAFLGWTLDGMDVMLYAFAIQPIRAEFGLGASAAGALASATLITGAVGGVLAGFLADRFGRVRVLIGSILVYSLATGGTATAHGLVALVAWRALVGFGLGAEWSAGSVLVAETWPASHRGRAIGLVQSGWAIGYLCAAGLAAAIVPRFGWRTLFVVGVLPALLTIWIFRRVREPEIWLRQRAAATGAAGAALPVSAAAAARPGDLLRPPLRRLTLAATALATALLFAYWGLVTWIPAFLSSPIDQGGAGLGLVKSAAFLVPMQIGAFLGYTLFGGLADRFGRRPAFLMFVLAAAAIVPLYGIAGRSPAALLALGPLVGFFGHGYFSLFGAMLSEIFPSSIRATAQGVCYNSGRAASALAPFAIGAAADRFGFGLALGMTAGLYLVGAALIFLLPETKGRALA